MVCTKFIPLKQPTKRYSDFDTDASESAAALRGRTDHELLVNPDLATRLGQVELPNDTVNPDRPWTTTNSQIPTNESCEQEIGEVRVPHADEASLTGFASVRDLQLQTQDTFDQITAASRAYRRIYNRGMDADSMAETIRSRTWSILSGISMSQVTSIGVIFLPLHETEWTKFKKIAFPDTTSAELQESLRQSPSAMSGNDLNLLFSQTKATLSSTMVVRELNVAENPWCSNFVGEQTVFRVMATSPELLKHMQKECQFMVWNLGFVQVWPAVVDAVFDMVSD